MAETALPLLWATSFELCWPLTHVSVKRWGYWGTAPPLLLVPSEMFLEQERCKDNPSWSNLRWCLPFSFFFTSHFVTVMESVLSKVAVPCPLPRLYFSLQRQSLSALLGIYLCILNSILFLLSLSFSALFLMSHGKSEVFISFIITFSPQQTFLASSLRCYIVILVRSVFSSYIIKTV